MPRTMVIDMSHHNEVPRSLVPAREAGVVGVIHKASEGTSFRDSKYDSRRLLASEAGLLWGAYHFLRAGNVEEQAVHFLNTADLRPGDLIAVDHEAEASLTELAAFLRAMRRKTGLQPVIYSGHTLKEQLAGRRHPEVNGENYRLWLAQYGNRYTLPPGWGTYWLWQWTDRGEVAGVTPPTDCNEFLGTAEEMKANWQANAAPPALAVRMDLREFQQALVEGGYEPGLVDGLWGPKTAAAAERWGKSGRELNVKE